MPKKNYKLSTIIYKWITVKKKYFCGSFDFYQDKILVPSKTSYIACATLKRARKESNNALILN